MKTWVKVVIGIVIAVLLVGAVGGVVAWTQSDKFDQKNLSYIGRYKIGGLDSKGNYSNVNSSIYTENAFECQGLNCTLAFDSNISYQIYFYDQNKDFVHTTGQLEKSFVEDSVPFFAKYARIVITPNDDNKVTQLEKDKYAKQLTVKVNREQGYKNYSENLFKIGYEHSDITTNGNISQQEENSDKVVCEYINVSSYKEAMLFRSTDVGGIKLHLYDSAKNHIGAYIISDIATLAFTSSEGYSYYSITFSSLHLDTTPCYMLLWCHKGNLVEVYCR